MARYTTPVRRAVIIGAGDTAASVVEAAGLLEIDPIACLDDDPSVKICCGVKVVGSTAELGRFARSSAVDLAVVAVVLDLEARGRLLQRCDDSNVPTPALVHPLASVSPTATISDGALVFPFAVLAAGARVGRGSVLKANSQLSYSTVVGDCCLVGPSTFIGPRAVLGDQVMVRAGAVVEGDATVESGEIVGVHEYRRTTAPRLEGLK